MKFFWLFTRDCWGYLLEKKSYDVSWPRTIICRWRGHPHGVRYFNASGLEPDFTCINCGDDLS